MRPLVSTLLALLLCACPPPSGSPSLSLLARPSVIDDLGGKTTLVISALDAQGQPGKGTVMLTAAAGTVDDASLTLDAMGTATSHFSCAFASNPMCKGRVSVTATWLDTSSTTRVQVGDAGITPPGDAGAHNADGGEPDGGPLSGDDGGESDGGFSDGGRAFAGDAGAVWLLGTLTPNAPQPALASLADPKHPAVGFPSDVDTGSAQLDAFGRLVYYDVSTATVRVMVPDPYDHAGTGAQYPADTTSNDLVLDTSGCEDAGLHATNFWMRANSTSFIYSCGSLGPYFENGRLLPELDGYVVLAAGADSVLTERLTTGATFDDAGAHGVQGFPNGETFTSLASPHRGREVRAVDGGYWVQRGTMDVETMGICNLYFVEGHTGNVTLLGQFTDLGAATAPLWCTGRLDSSGVLYTPAATGSTHVVVARPLVQSTHITTTAYTESGSTPSTFGSYPPNVFTFVDSSSSLVTGP